MQVLIGKQIINYELKTAKKQSNLMIVFLHGWGRTLTDFDALCQKLALHFPDAAFLQIDLPGFGSSPLEREDGLSLDNYCEILKDFFNKLGIAKAILIGHSFGGRVAIKFSVRFPEYVEKLVLISAAGITQKSLRGETLAIARGLWQTMFSAWEDFRFILRLKNLLGALLGSEDYRTTHGALRETFKKTIAEDLQNDAPKIKSPTMLLWGSQDEITPLEQGHIYQQLIPDSKLEVIPGGHFAFIEHADAASAAIISFLKHA